MGRSPRFLGFLVGMVSLLAGSVGLARYLGQARTGMFSCLRFFDDNKLVDIVSGAVLIDKRGPRWPPVNDLLGAQSPDGKYHVFLTNATSDVHQQQMWLESVENGERRLLLDPVSDVRGFVWSTDSRWMVYTWQGADQHWFITAASVDGRRTSSRPITSPNASNPFFSLTPDGPLAVFAVQAGKRLDLHILSVTDDIVTSLPLKAIPTSVVWSPHKDRFAYQQPDHSLTFVSLKTMTQVTYSLPDEIGVTGLLWSPDEQHVAVYMPLGNSSDTAHYQLIILDTTTTVATAVDTFQYYDPVMWQAWSQDSKSLSYFRFYQRNTYAHDLMVFHLDTRQLETLADDVGGNSNHSEAVDPYEEQRLVVPWQQDGKVTVDTMDIDGRHRSTLLVGADAVDILRIPQTHIVVLAWQVRSGDSTQTRLLWSKADGSSVGQLRDAAGYIWGLTSSADGHSLMYITSHASPDDSEIHRLNLASGEDIVLKDHLHSIAIASDLYDMQPHALFFWWQADDASTGVSIWEAGRETAFNFAVIGTPQIGSGLGTFAFEPAADGKTGILYSVDSQGVSLQLGKGNGEPAQLVAEGIALSSNYGFKWSPDGAYFAYNFAEPNQHWIVRVVGADGIERREFRSAFDLDTAFTACD